MKLYWWEFRYIIYFDCSFSRKRIKSWNQRIKWNKYSGEVIWGNQIEKKQLKIENQLKKAENLAMEWLQPNVLRLTDAVKRTQDGQNYFHWNPKIGEER